MPRPSDFFLNVLDLFAVLLPGAVLTAIAWPTLEPLIEDRIGSVGSGASVVAFTVLAYIAGQLAHVAGSLLDHPYDRWRKRSIESDKYKQLAEQHANQHDGRDDAVSIYKWAEAQVRVRNPAAIAEVDRLQGQSKFFRNLLVVLAVLAIDGFIDGNGWQLIGAIALLPLSVWRFFDVRLKATDQLYLYYIVTGRN